MSASLVGSEMCIRDRLLLPRQNTRTTLAGRTIRACETLLVHQSWGRIRVALSAARSHPGGGREPAWWFASVASSSGQGRSEVGDVRWRGAPLLPPER
eukprot:13352550-Alexandrium_andersonii.AAC.1